MRWILTLLLVFPAVGRAQGWKDQLEVFASVEQVRAPQGYDVVTAPGGRVVKKVSKPETINTKAVLDHEGKRYYMSDWSWKRYSGGKDPFWIVVRGEESPSKPLPDEIEVVSSKRPLTVPEKLGKKWDGEVEVFSSSRSFAAPEGYRLLSEPDRKTTALKATSTRTRISARAALTRRDGHVYYISDWSWSRLRNGHEPNWMHLTGVKPRPAPAEPKSRTVAEEDAAEEEPAVAGVGTASLVEKVIRMARPKVSLVEETEASGRVVALLLGNSDYASANRAQRMLNLDDPSHNVDLLGKTLRTLNAEVRVETDLNRQEMTRVIRETTQGLREGDVFLFYYAGHALQLNGENYLAPLGINFLDRATVRSSAYRLDHLLEAVADRSLRFAGIFLDCSRKNPFNTKDSSFYILSRIPGLNLNSNVGTKPGLASERPPPNTLISYAAEPGEIMAPPRTVAKHSRYAAALTSALGENLEIREVMGMVKTRVRNWTAGEQLPWTAEGEFGQFYLLTPARNSLDPDMAVGKAGQWVAREQEKGIPMALALLARSVREQPENNAATAGLLFLLAHQAVPVPLESWGPFEVDDTELSPEMQLSIDGRYLALFPKNGDKPSRILDRQKDKILSEVYESFAPGYGAVEVRSERLVSHLPREGDPLSVVSVKRQPGDLDSDQQVASTYAATPILTGDPMVAWFYDEGLERLCLALRNEKDQLVFQEYATTVPVRSHDDFRVVDETPELEKSGRVDLAEGTIPGGSGGESWKLVFDGPTGEIRFFRDGKVVYRRSGALRGRKQLDDWRVDPSANAVALVYRDQVDFLTLNGSVISEFALNPDSVKGRSIMTFHAAFRRIAIASDLKGDDGDAGAKDIALFDLSTGKPIGGGQALEGYATYAGLSPDEEWFFFYDGSRRLRMVDMLTGGARINFPGTATLQPLPVGADLEPSGETEGFSYEVAQAPLEKGWGDASSRAPAWLADLAEAVAGFRVNEKGELEWLPDASQRLQSTVRQMAKRNRTETQEAWSEWLLTHRLGALAES